MGILIDSSVLIHFERAGADLFSYVAGRENERAFLREFQRVPGLNVEKWE